MSGQARVTTEEDLRLGEVGEALAWGGTERLIGDITHELNNALGVVLNNAMMVAASAPSDSEIATDARELLEGARWAVAQSRLLGALGHRHQPGLNATDVTALIGSLEPVLRRGLGGGTELQITVDAGLPAVWVEPNVLSRSLLALVLARADELDPGATLRLYARFDEPAGAVLLELDGEAVAFDPMRAGARALVAAAGGSLDVADAEPGHAALVLALPLPAH